MSNFEKCKRAYAIGATKDQLKVWVAAGRITEAEYAEITGETYAV